MGEKRIIIKLFENNLNIDLSCLMTFYLRIIFTALYEKKWIVLQKNRSKHKKRGGEMAFRYL